MVTSYHPATAHRLEIPLVLLPGWGFEQRIWQELLPRLREWTDVHTVNLCYKAADVDTLLNGLIKNLPDQVILVGWSLGGMLATRVAARFPDRVAGLITLASNGTFVARSHWPDAMAVRTFQQFSQKVQQNPQSGLKRFCKLVTHGDQHSAQQLPYLQSLVSSADSGELLPGLMLLSELDNTRYLPTIECPALHIFGQQDVLVPESAVKKLAGVFSHRHRMQVLVNRGHLLHQPVVDITPLLNDFLSALEPRHG